MPARSIRTAILVMLVATAVSAQSLHSGMIVALRSKSGGYLSAQPNPPQSLALAPHAAGWEQWEYRVESGHARFVSYHGTALIIDRRGTAYHAPVSQPSDGGVTVVAVVGDSPNAKQRSGSAPIVMNGLVTLSSGGLLLCDEGQRLKTKHESRTANVSTPDEWWTVVPVATADGTRAAVLQRALTLGKRYFLQSAHGTFVDGRSDTGVQDVQLRAIHGRGKAQSFGFEKVAYNPLNEQSLTFGEQVRIHYKHFLLGSHSTPYYLKPIAETGGQFHLPLVAIVPGHVSGTEWTIVDPTGRYRAGDRVPVGATVLLRNVGTQKNLSADTSIEQLVISPNSAGWEQWVVME